jgi:hypothetical protein
MQRRAPFSKEAREAYTKLTKLFASGHPESVTQPMGEAILKKLGPTDSLVVQEKLARKVLRNLESSELV